MAETLQSSGSQCTCACHQGAVTGCMTKVKAGVKACCSVCEIAHDSPVICPYCNGLADRLSSQVLECTGNRHLMPDHRHELSVLLTVTHATRR